jgi:putative acetyltransferase
VSQLARPILLLAKLLMNKIYLDFTIRDWQKRDRTAAANVIQQILQEYSLSWEPMGADRDVIDVETAYLSVGGEFWVIEQQGEVVGTAAYYPIARGNQAVEIRKMYLLPEVRGKGLGKYLLKQLEDAIALKGFQEIWIETASVLKEAVILYENSGYLRTTGTETQRCDRVYLKSLI